MNIQEIREKYPQYDNLSDSQLAEGLHKKYYSDMPFEDFSQRIGLNVASQVPEDIEGALSAFSKGYTFGFGDKAMGVVNALGAAPIDAIMGRKNIFKSAKDRYKEVTNSSDEARNNFSARHPIKADGLVLGGTLANPISLMSAVKVMKAPTYLSKILTGMGLGAGEGSLMGAGQAETLSDAPVEILKGGTIGSVLGGLFPAVGGAYRAAKGFDNIPRSAIGSIENVASNLDATKIVKRGMHSNNKFARETAQAAQNALEDSASRVRSAILEGADSSGVLGSIKSAKDEYSRFINNNANKKIPKSWEKNFFKDNPDAEDMYQYIVRHNPVFAKNNSKNSVGMLQEIRTRLNADIRGMSEKNSRKIDYKRASDSLKDVIDNQFVGFKDLQPIYARAKSADNLLETIDNVVSRSKEGSNIAGALLKENIKDDILSVFGQKKGDALLKALRNERTIIDNLNSLSKTGYKPFLGGLEKLFGNAGVFASIVNPANTIPALLGIGTALGGKAALRKGLMNTAKNVLSGNVKKSNVLLSPYLSSATTRGIISETE
jgi:hypothetical protein